MDKYPYKITNSAGVQVLEATESCRYPKQTELALLQSGYTIRLHGKRITRKDVSK